MTISELQTMTKAQMIDWLIADVWKHEPQAVFLQTKMLEAAHAGTLGDDLLGRWIEANREAGERMHAEARTLHKYGRIKRAGITAVIDGGPEAA